MERNVSKTSLAVEMESDLNVGCLLKDILKGDWHLCKRRVHGHEYSGTVLTPAKVSAVALCNVHTVKKDTCYSCIIIKLILSSGTHHKDL